MSDYSLSLRMAIIEFLRANIAVQALVEQRIFESLADEKTERPYIRYGVDIITPFEAQGLDGSDIDVTLHVFDEAPDTDRVRTVMKAIEAALDEAALTLEEGFLFWITWTGSQLVPDEAGQNQRHGIVQFNAVING